MKLELKHLAPYLPHDVKLNYECLSFDGRDDWFQLKEVTMTPILLTEIFNSKSGIRNAKLILYPLSDLTKEIQVNGNKFVPIEKINRTHPEYPIEIDENTVFFTDACELNMLEMTEIYSIFQKLLEWHFDINGLIGKGWAIDINTLSK